MLMLTACNHVYGSGKWDPPHVQKSRQTEAEHFLLLGSWANAFNFLFFNISICLKWYGKATGCQGQKFEPLQGSRWTILSFFFVIQAHGWMKLCPFSLQVPGQKNPNKNTHTRKIYLGHNRLSYEKVSTWKIQMGFSGNLKFSIRWCFLLFGLCKSFCYLCAAPVSHHSSQGHCADTEALLGFLPCGKIRKSKPRHKKAARKVQNELLNTFILVCAFIILLGLSDTLRALCSHFVWLIMR